jgi:multidrug efflux pump subunit AcrA (membrane-fusion protein)
MGNHGVINLAECTEFCQTLQARPPRIVHGTALLLALLLGTALSWSALTEADLVVRAKGQVRPVTSPVKVFLPVRGGVASASLGGRVVEVKVQRGDRVGRGDVLLRLDTEQLDIEVAKQRGIIAAGRSELRELALLAELAAQLYQASLAKAEGDLERAREEVGREKQQQEIDLHYGPRFLELDYRQLNREELLQMKNAAAATDVDKARKQFLESQKKLKEAGLLVLEAKVIVAQREIARVKSEYGVERKKQEMEREKKQAEVVAAENELRRLETEWEQAVVRAPLAGVVTAGDVKVGVILKPGEQVAEIAEEKGFRFEAQVPSEDIAHLREGMPARIRINAYDYQRYGTLDGTVFFISPDASVGEGQHAASYLVKIELAQDEVGRGEYRGRIKLGMEGLAEIVTEHESLLSLLVKRIRQTISLG